MPAVNDNVLAQWKRGKFYLAQVTHVNAGVYDVYFPECGSVKKRLQPRQLRPLDESVARSTPTRTELVRCNQKFYFDGDNELAAGYWTVRRIKGNAYVCSRVTGKGPCNIEEFDIGYVMRCCTDMQERVRERGPEHRTSL